MTCSTSCSARAAGLLLLAAFAAGAGACRHGPRAGLDRPLRLVVLPPHDLSTNGAPLPEIRVAAELQLARIGAEVVTGAVVDEFLATRRTRYTGGIDAAVAADARDVLGADAVLVTTVGGWRELTPAAVQVTMRMLSAEPEPRILWIEGASASGAEGVGFLGLGGKGHPAELLPGVLRQLRDGLRAAVNGKGRRSVACGVDATFEPQTEFRYAGLDVSRPRKVAVLPFESRTGRRSAGEVVALEVARGLASVPSLRILEPGVVRAMMLSGRFVMVEGLSLEIGDLLMANAEVDLVVTGRVDEYDEGAPAMSFSVAVYDTRLRQVVFRSASHHRGTDGVYFFDAGQVHDAGALACRMVAPIVRSIARSPGSVRRLSSLEPTQPLRLGVVPQANP